MLFVKQLVLEVQCFKYIMRLLILKSNEENFKKCYNRMEYFLIFKQVIANSTTRLKKITFILSLPLLEVL